ncbi:MAG: endolytic transglycosylase MltG, partial [Deltaproteobacteria bacterium]
DFLAKAWEGRAPDLPISSPREALILASIVEKETGQADERHRVAAVFSNRLKKKMRLQSDPTIIYGVAGGRGSLGRPISRTDIDTKTEYNTYRINGLPPGPICNPGRETIEATLNPAKTNDLYFVADGTGGHTFSETLAAHNAAVQNWRKIEKSQAQEGRGSAGPGLAESDGDGATGDAEEAAAVAGGTAAAASVASPSGKTSTVPLPVRKPKAGQN